VTKLILLSGLLCDETVWAEVAARLRDAADIEIRSFPGFDSIGAMADDVLGHAAGRFAVAGHSMGGRVALEIVRRAPGRVSGLALLNTGVHPVRAGEAESRGRLMQIARTQGMRALAAEWLPPMMGAPADRVAELRPRLDAMIERATPESFAAQIAALLARPDAEPVLATIRVPVLLASGTADRWSPLPQHEAMRERIPQARLVAIEDAGHMAPVEQPGAVADALRTWLAAL
jgi:pimeloyl-ACP methyl ester carboxylesterase